MLLLRAARLLVCSVVCACAVWGAWIRFVRHEIVTHCIFFAEKLCNVAVARCMYILGAESGDEVL